MTLDHASAHKVATGLLERARGGVARRLTNLARCYVALNPNGESMTNRTNSAITIDASLKRIAWGFGCAKKGSPEEAFLGELLVQKVKKTEGEKNEDDNGS